MPDTDYSKMIKSLWQHRYTGYCAKKNKPERKRQIPNHLYRQSKKKTKQKTNEQRRRKLINTENKQVADRGRKVLDEQHRWRG